MRVSFMICCEYANRFMNGAPALLGIFRSIQVDSFPTTLDPFYLTMELEAEPHEYGPMVFLIRLIDEDGRAYFEAEMGMDFAKRENYGPSYGYFGEVLQATRPIEKPGIYRIDLLHEGEVIGQTHIEVFKRDLDRDSND
ncbi:MAG: hypothetical protein JST35_01455 [Armatimonadetes bacterium]|nr:hypothetical protein [Armatimonadota bacterium]